MKEKHISRFEEDIDFLKRNKQSFKIVTGANSIQIKHGKTVYDYVAEFKNFTRDENFAILALISKVKSDANKYIKRGMPIELGRKLLWSEAISNRYTSGELYKIDISGAYWQAGVNMGIISEETDRYLKEKKEVFRTPRNFKHARLKSLGVLRSQKIIKEFEDGNFVIEYKKKNDNFIAIYDSIALHVQEVMESIANEVTGVIAYYHDCIFLTNKENISLVKDIMSEEGFSSRMDGEFDYIAKPSRGYLAMLTKDKNNGDSSQYVFNKFFITKI